MHIRIACILSMFFWVATATRCQQTTSMMPFSYFTMTVFSPQEIAWEAYFSREDPAGCKILWPPHNTPNDDANNVWVAWRNVETAWLFENGRPVVFRRMPLAYEEYNTQAIDFRTTRRLECVGFDAVDRMIAYDRVDFEPWAPLPVTPGELVGSMWITYYYLSVETDFTGRAEIPIHDAKCRLMAFVPYCFARDVCVEGSGRLIEGTIINYASRCDCAIPCPLGGRVCYEEVQNPKAIWGLGSRRNPLIPLRSLAVDNHVIPYGANLYIPEWDGIDIPNIDGIGGFIHDGCFRADDVGGAIRGDHVDFFAGTRAMWLLLERRFPTRSRFTVYMNSPRCYLWQ